MILLQNCCRTERQGEDFSFWLSWDCVQWIPQTTRCFSVTCSPSTKNTEVWREKQELWIPTSCVWLLPCTSWPRASLAGPPPSLLVLPIGTVLQRCRKLPGALCKRLAWGRAPRPCAVQVPAFSEFFATVNFLSAFFGQVPMVAHVRLFHARSLFTFD